MPLKGQKIKKYFFIFFKKHNEGHAHTMHVPHKKHSLKPKFFFKTTLNEELYVPCPKIERAPTSHPLQVAPSTEPLC